MNDSQPIIHIEMLRVLAPGGLQNLNGLIELAGLKQRPGHLQGLIRIAP
jgi:hypothetical protein